VVYVIVMIVSALAAAALYGGGAAAEQRQAARAPESSAGRPRLLLLLVRQPLWLLGIAAQFGGFAAHAVALRSGPLATVQMLVALELVVAVVIVRIWSGRPLSRASWAAALTVAAGISAFLLLASPSGHGLTGDLPHHGMAAALGAAAAGAGAVAAAAAGLRAAGRRRAVLLAVAAGLGDTCSAVVTMGFAHVASHGVAAVVTSWTTLAVVVCGIGNVLLTQTAYQTGRPLITLPIISAVTPVASVAIGIGLLGETPRVGVAGGVAAGFAVLVTSLALAFLARSVPPSQPEAVRQQKTEPQRKLVPGPRAACRAPAAVEVTELMADEDLLELAASGR
jgi:drug/metabolite transporter (DMT)-like permease